MATLQTLPEAATLLPATAVARSSTTLAARAFLYAVFKHRRLVIGVALLIFLTSAVMALIRPRTWRATSKVMVKLGETVQLAPAEAPSKSIQLPLSPQVVNTEAELVKSRDVLKEAVARLGIKPEDGKSLDEMIAGMALALSVVPTPSSNVLQISYVGRDPQRAAKVVNTITDVYIEHHNRVYSPSGMQSFYSEQLDLLREQMKAAQRRLRNFMRKAGVADIEQEIHILNQDVIEQEKGLQAHGLKIVGVQEKLKQVERQLAETPQKIAFAEEFLANPTIQTFRDKLAQIEIERAQLLQRYQPTHRAIRDKDEEIARIRARIAEEKARFLNKETVQENETYRALVGNRNTLRVLLADLQARQPGLEARLARTRARLETLRDMRFKLDNLRQDADQKEYAFDLYWRKQEEARTSEAMKNQSMVNVTVVDKATAPLTPINSPLLPIVLGLVGGLALATAMAVAVEYLNRRLRFEEEVERYLELPVLAVIPDLETSPTVAHA